MSHFFAYLARMKFIRRWGLMRNTVPESIQEHSLQVAMIAHALALFANERAGASVVDPARVALLAVFHDAEEVITGDLPSPIKYFNPAVRDAFGTLGDVARRRLLSLLPEAQRGAYEPLLLPTPADAGAWRLVKLADKLSAYLKCVEEAAAGNREFADAERALLSDLTDLHDPDVERFLSTYAPSFHLTLDQLG